MLKNVDWSQIDPEMTDFVLSQSEKYLATQIQTSLAADQRALTTASIFTTLGAAILTAAIAYWTIEKNTAVLAAGIAAGVAAVGGALLCLYAARPTDFYFPGATPEAWVPALSEPLKTAKGGEIENYQANIDDNDIVLSKNAKALWAGSVIAASSPAVGGLVWSITVLFFQA
ncbi:hypothetical protein [Agrobacterium rubi]|uniref:Uncharacterized protein n=1 Tax=Agrobacterium rubi TaxID=28099 RepID=A0AAE7R9M8_9HYPH|nr:hypothetical protein [Agrobacterium rubi]NTE89646.1 hypothetical protein [Agrobacterium rubi]NTF05504.1 hypothetical protein [Agrobacterium rubi]NTF39947.1 hypothetical protein [Agrobacterium rubi]OCJ44759.1 hypothetical protein A6U92_16040 [Agrobacterium rubi]QTG03856.1 hypothetical protein G6M88_25785 [Agrobacterium rubi]